MIALVFDIPLNTFDNKKIRSRIDLSILLKAFLMRSLLSFALVDTS